MNKNIFCRILTVFLLILPVAALFMCIHRYGVNVVFWDEWAVVDLYEDLVTNGFSFAKLFAQHNEHRMFFPNIIMLIASCLSGWNTKVEMYLSACMLSAIYYICAKIAIGKGIRDWTGKDALFASLLGGCLISACQWENLLMGFQLAWYLLVMSVILSLVFFSKYYEKNEIKYGIVSMVFATIATYSSLQGVAIWFMYLAISAILLISKQKMPEAATRIESIVISVRLIGKKMIPFGIVGTAEIMFYFWGYSRVENHGEYQTTNIVQCLEFMMKQIGYIFNNSNERVALFLGILLTLLSILLVSYLIHIKKAEQYIASIGMMIFGMGVILMISIGRSNLALASRYTTFALMILAGEISIIYREINQKMSTVPVNIELCQIFAAVEGMMIALCIVESLDSLQICGLTYTSRMEAREALQNYKDVPLDALQKVCYWQNYEETYKAAHILEQRNWNVWKDKHLLYEKADMNGIEISYEPLNTYNVEAIIWDNECKVISVGGWAVDHDSEQMYDHLLVKVNDIYYKSKDHLERKDVAEYFENEKFEHTGFSFSKSVDVLHEGVNTISLLLITQDGKTAYASHDFYIYFSRETGLYCCDESGEAIG